MKFIRIESLSPELSIDIHPDSAMILPGRPLFMPEWGENWEVRLHPAVKIGRLGKNIAPKFASRYFDGFTLACRVTLPDADSTRLRGVISGMDSSLFYGEWQPADTTAADHTVSLNGSDIALPRLADAISDAIAKVSEYMTLKMGDIILLPEIGHSVGLSEGINIEANLDVTPIVAQRVV